ncbi:MAG TPA: hypothetical protein VGX75_17895 [bacterium]|nr:hypothetical protein [bacterium]
MAIGNLEIRMAHFEGAYEQIDKRLGTIETDVRALRTDLVSRTDDLASRINGLRTRLDDRTDGLASQFNARVEVLATRLDDRTDDLASRSDVNGLRSALIGRMDRQFFWVLGLLIVSILLPIARSAGH